MNYMPEIAKLLGVEIGEEFILRNPVNNYTFDKLTYQIDEKGLLEKSKERVTRCSTDYTFIKLLRGEFAIVKIPKPILNEIENKYLSAVIKPFRNRIKYICKNNNEDGDTEFLDVQLDDNDFMAFPNFKKGTMYKGMEFEKKYTLEHLNI